MIQNVIGMTDMEREIIQAIRNLPPREQAAIMSYVLALEKEALEEK